MDVLTFLAILAVCVTVLLCVGMWTTTRRKYPR